MINIIDKHSRRVLNEGRNNGMAFGFLKKIDDNQFHTVQPPSPCKDYLAEVVFTENYGIPAKGCGLHYKQKNEIFSDKAYLAIKILKTMSGAYNYSKSFEGDIEKLKANYEHMQRLMRDFESRLELKVLTTITPAEDDFFVVEFSSYWCRSSHSISLYSLLLRVLMVATEEDKDILEFIKTYNYQFSDKNLLTQCSAKINLILKEKQLPPNTIPYSKSAVSKFMQSPHHNGILAWKSTFEETQLGE